MLRKKTFVDQIEITRSNVIQVRFLKAIVDGDAIIANEYHRVALEPGADLVQCQAVISNHMKVMGYPAIADDEWLRVTRIAAVVHTTEVVADFREKAKVKAEKADEKP